MAKFSIEALFKAKDGISATAGRIGKSVGSLGVSTASALGVANRAIDKVHGGLAKVGKAAAAAGVAIGGLGTAAALSIGKTGADFEEAITSVGAVGLQTRDQIKDLEDEALRLGATTAFTATQAANAMELMARAGFSNQEILSGVSGVLSAAAASGLEMAEVANHVSNVLKGMGLQASEAGRVADVLTVASSKTNTSIGSLGAAMKNLSPVAKQFGISFEDAVAGVALLQDVGMDESESGTAMATMLTKLAKPADSVAKKMKELGVTFQDAKGNMLPPVQIFENMKKAADGLGGNMDQVAFFADLVGLRGQKAALNLKDLFNSDKGQELTRALDKALGSSEKMAALRMDNLKGDLTLLESAVDGVKVALFNLESGPLRGVVQGMTDWVSENQELIVSGAEKFMTALRANMSKIVVWLKRIAVGVAAFYAVAAAVKVANAAMVVFSVTSKVVAFGVRQVRVALIAAELAFYMLRTSTALQTAATWAYNAAITAGQIATTRYTVAGLASAAATRAASIATGVYTTVLKAVTVAKTAVAAATVRGTAATVASRVAVLASRGAHVVYAAAIGAVTVAKGAYAIATGKAAAATGIMSASLAPLIVTVAALTAAVTALIAAWDQLTKLVAEVGGWDGLGAGVKSFLKGDGFFAGMDELANQKARAAAANRPQMVSPQERTASSISETHTSLEQTAELLIRDLTGRAALNAPAGSPFNLVQEPSGAL